MAKFFSPNSDRASNGNRRRFMPVAGVLAVPMLLVLGQGVATPRDEGGDPSWPKAQQRLIQTIQQRPTEDGATVAEVLAYAERERPDRFKVSQLQVQYDAAGREPEAITIAYWIGQNRKMNDSYVDLSYTLNAKGQVQPVPRSALTLRALESGKASFVQQVDAIYAMACKPFPESKARC